MVGRAGYRALTCRVVRSIASEVAVPDAWAPKPRLPLGACQCNLASESVTFSEQALGDKSSPAGACTGGDRPRQSSNTSPLHSVGAFPCAYCRNHQGAQTRDQGTGRWSSTDWQRVTRGKGMRQKPSRHPGDTLREDRETGNPVPCSGNGFRSPSAIQHHGLA